ncbi:MAG: alanine--tRNA ligase, partial [Nitriliruptorales bacterium]|nr:alanine--tRNA ligase [Nitriliruptorales bacterium]
GADRLDACDNFWSTGAAGPCGPCTELFYDRGPAWGEEGGPAVNEERYLEFYNLVFIQHEQDADGNVVGDLPNENVDTGMGLERMAVLLQDVANVFETSALRPMLDRAQELTGVDYGEDDDADVSLRVIAEHARTSSFLIADGVLPAKEGRGYVLRRLLRRAIRHAHLLGHDGAIIQPMIDADIATMGPGYPELERQRELVTRVATAEEADFTKRLEQGLEMVDGAITSARDAGTDTIPGDVAFKLHDTFGFPVDLTAEIAEDAGIALDRAEFERHMEEQRARARAAAKGDGGGIPAEIYRQASGSVGSTEFLGYDRLAAEANLGAIVTPGGLIEEATEGDEVEIVLPRTPFYAEGGGQVGDRGEMRTATGRLRIVDTQEAVEGLTVHRAQVVAGEVRTGQPVEASVDPDFRIATARSHSATHILHATIREELGDHAQQAGSLVQPGRLRFDFPHFEQVPSSRLDELEERLNQRVLLDPRVETDVMGIDEAKAAGAVANFGDKYGQVVRVVTIGDFSKELCGGTHVPSGARIGTIHIVREESIGSNTRRIEALTGLDALRYVNRERQVAEEVARLVGTGTDEAVSRVENLLERLKAVEKELERARTANLAQEANAMAEAAERQDGNALVVREIDDVSMDDLRQLANEIRGQLAERAVVVLGTRTDDGKAQLVAVVTQDLVDRGVEARPILHPAAQIVGGGAGGRGDMAQAGGREGARLTEALDEARAQAQRAVADA